ncbi:MAG: N-acetyltransferase [Cyanobacteria bacterium P01_D01_bin.105]
MNIQIREASNAELDDVLSVERASFGENEEAELVRALLNDESALPLLSLLAWNGDLAVGHILFTAARLSAHQSNNQSNNQSSNPLTPSISLLAPLAVIPEMQKQGIGAQLIKNGLQRLSQSGIELVFVLGYPDYYSRHGFVPAGALGFEAPYPILEKNADAWMVQALRPNLLGHVSGTVVCAKELNKPELWKEE